MPIVSLRDLYVAELKDLYDAEQQILRELPVMASKATSGHLRDALQQHLKETLTHVERLDLIFRQLGMPPAVERSEAIRGLIIEGQRRLEQCERGDAMDAALIGMAQRAEHYEIAGYGCARTYARTLNETPAADLLQQTLDEEGRADHRLTAIAERGINQSAGEDTATPDPRAKSRLRYIDAGDLRAFPHRDFPILNEHDENLGTLDGFIVERSGRPVYYVIDSGGWFLGRRYLVPVGMLHSDDGASVLRTGLDRDTIERYPEFNSSAFLAMDDDEAHRYEHRLLTIVAPDIARRGSMPDYTRIPEYLPPTWLMTGFWMTEGIDLSAVPPPAHADAEALCREKNEQKERRSPVSNEQRTERELMMARETPEQDRRVPDSGDVRARETEQPKTVDPRLERYRER